LLSCCLSKTSSLYIFFSSFAFFLILWLFVILFSSLLSVIFQLHFPHSCCKTHCKHKTWMFYQETFNAIKKLDHHFVPLFFCLGQPTIFVLNNHFIQIVHPKYNFKWFLKYEHKKVN
jgi:hypothetical protein